MKLYSVLDNWVKRGAPSQVCKMLQEIRSMTRIKTQLIKTNVKELYLCILEYVYCFCFVHI